MKERFINFMQGRYGVDNLNNHALVLVVVLFVINMFFNNMIITFIAYALWIMVIYRMFSKQTTKRYNENEKYLNTFRPVSQFFSLQKQRLQDRNNKYYRCPSCHQMIRVPKKRGKIVITCPKCANKFEKRT